MEKTTDVIIPTYRPGKEFGRLIERLQKQSCPIHRIIIMNTEEKFWNKEWDEKYPFLEVHHIPKAEFDQGSTGKPGSSTGFCQRSRDKGDHPHTESRRGRKNLRFRIYQGNFRSCQITAWSGYRQKETSASKPDQKPGRYTGSGQTSPEGNRKPESMDQRGVSAGRN